MWLLRGQSVMPKGLCPTISSRGKGRFACLQYDLAAIWANKQKGNNPNNSTYYNFSIL